MDGLVVMIRKTVLIQFIVVFKNYKRITIIKFIKKKTITKKWDKQKHVHKKMKEAQEKVKRNPYFNDYKEEAKDAELNWYEINKQ